MMASDKAILLLEDGSIFEGVSFGQSGYSIGEICFNTGMTGYQEVFTDPSYAGQIMVTTNAHIGNYGTSPADTESGCIQISALVCKNFTTHYSRKLANESISTYFGDNDVLVISDVDTRAIVKHIRNKGAMNAIIACGEWELDDLQTKLSAAPSMAGLELASKVSTTQAYDMGDFESSIRIAVMDYGVKKNILNCLVERGAFLRVFPAQTSLSEVQEWNPDGYFLSNGPGDPGAMSYATEFAKEILDLGDVPVFGICLGHQILAQSLGISTYKMHHGHRGINHPVKNVITGKSEITSQNHGFGISREDIDKNSDLVEITHINLNDDTVEGFRHRNLPVFSVQYHPESSPGPHDSRYLFDHFIQLIKEHK